MSEFIVVNTQINDLEVLKRTLADFGVNESQIEVHDEPVRIEGYGGQTRNAHVVIRKKALNSAYDIGFERNADGTYRVWISDSWGKLGTAIRDGEFVQKYAQRKMLKGIEQQYGLRVDACEEKDGKIEIMVESE